MFRRIVNTYMHDVHIAVESILGNKLKSMLTALGIIFGVAAVISMLAIGNGAQQEILDQIKMVGVNNIVIVPVEDVSDDDESASEGSGQSKKFSPGLTLADADAIRKVLPGVARISPEVTMNSYVMQSGVRYPAKLLGVATDFFDLYNLPLESGGYFTDYQSESGLSVCVIGYNIRTKFFNNANPIGEYIKFGNTWLKVVGVLAKSQTTTNSAFDNAGVNVYNDNVFIPVKTMLMRYQNRALANTKQSGGVSFIGGGGFFRMVNTTTASDQSKKNYNQLDRIIVQVKETEELTSATEVLGRLMLRRHQGVKDYEITVPELLLKQQQRTKDVFNIVLGAIAGISLLVGGIGIMNIMFASVMERIKEIGTRLAIGAKKRDIVAQFLSEAILISVTGGAIGVLLGVALSLVIEYSFGIKTIISFFSIVIAFGVSAAVGVIFGYSPAKRAAERDPIESLRYE
jgi:putative ABC transport system permease protein